LTYRDALRLHVVLYCCAADFGALAGDSEDQTAELSLQLPSSGFRFRLSSDYAISIDARLSRFIWDVDGYPDMPWQVGMAKRMRIWHI